MGMYTHLRGWIRINDIDFSAKDFKNLMKKAEKISPRSSQCIKCTVFNQGFNWCPYIFIGGEIKNYDDDWNIFIKFLFNNLEEIRDYHLQKKYEEDDDWGILILNEKGETI